jgi:catalase
MEGSLMPTTARGLYEQIVDVFNAIYGAHDGSRAVHAKGTLCAGTFTANAAALELTSAAHMQGTPVRAHVRFSNASGDPNKPDGSREGRGMGVKLYLDDGATTDIVAVTVPVFVARTPEDFLEITSTRIPDPATGKPDPKKIESYLERHPEAMGSIFAAMSFQPPASYLQLTYHAVHAFRFENARGESRWVRYRWEPESGEAFLDPAEAKQRDLHYLRAELEERFGTGGGAFRLTAQIAEEGDDVTDPTTAWPDERACVELGRLEVTGFAFDREQDDDVLVFDPTRVTAGIGLSEDRILNARPHAYAESVYRRSGVRRG